MLAGASPPLVQVPSLCALSEAPKMPRRAQDLYRGLYKPWNASLPLTALGASSGMIVPAYLASVGVLQQRFDSDTLHGPQVAVVVMASVGAVLCEEALAERERPPLHALQRRLALLCVAAAAVLLRLPVCDSEAEVLFTGALCAMLGTLMLEAALKLGTLLGDAASVAAGSSLACFAIVALVSACKLGSLAQIRGVYVFYGSCSTLCVVGTFFCLWSTGLWYGLLGEGDADEDTDDETLASETTPLRGLATTDVPAGMRTLLYAGRGPNVEVAADVGYYSDLFTTRPLFSLSVLGTSCQRCFSLMALFLLVATSFVLLPLFPVAGAADATLLFQMRCLGEGLGGLVATFRLWDFADFRAPGCASGLMQLCIAGLAIANFVGALFVVAWIFGAHSGSRHHRLAVPEWLVVMLVVFIFFVGTYCTSVLDWDCLLRVPPAGRPAARRWNRLVLVGGQLLSLALGLAMVQP